MLFLERRPVTMKIPPVPSKTTAANKASWATRKNGKPGQPLRGLSYADTKPGEGALTSAYSTEKDLTVSTKVRHNNWVGSVYFLPVQFFHRLLFKTMLRRALALAVEL